jgi:hypothetical protein
MQAQSGDAQAACCVPGSSNRSRGGRPFDTTRPHWLEQGEKKGIAETENHRTDLSLTRAESGAFFGVPPGRLVFGLLRSDGLFQRSGLWPWRCPFGGF